MEERTACAQLKRRFEAAGFHIEENQLFDEDGVRFEIDGFDAKRRVGYEYVTKEAGDGWDVDADVIAALAERRKRGELHVLIVDEADAPDAATLDAAIDAFLKALPDGGVTEGDGSIAGQGPRDSLARGTPRGVRPDAPAPPQPTEEPTATEDKPVKPAKPASKKTSSRKSK